MRKIRSDIKRIVKIIIMAVMVIVSVNNCYADVMEEVDIEYADIYKGYESFMKNFITEIGEVQVSLYDEKGNEIWKYNVMPKEFEENNEVKREFKDGGHTVGESTTTDYDTTGSRKDGISTEITTTGDETWILQKNEGLIDISEMKKRSGISGEEIKVAYSDNIPCLIKLFDSNNDELSYVRFDTSYTTYTDTEEWRSANEGENVNKLAEDIGEKSNSVYKSFDSESSIEKYGEIG